MTRELRVVAVDHCSTVGQIFREEVAEPHAPQIALSPPRPIRVSVQARDGNDARDPISVLRLQAVVEILLSRDWIIGEIGRASCRERVSSPV